MVRSRIFARRRVHLLVAAVELYAQPRCLELLRDLLTVGVVPLGDGDERDLHGREPQREGSGIVFDGQKSSRGGEDRRCAPALVPL
ncbi:MAG: hypothetical protein QOH85_2095 [Acidobacteriaceae bacterium]|jgi:hypothetical protein|nr:hypothetical protein [Acidobacteriaceae bacterium]